MKQIILGLMSLNKLSYEEAEKLILYAIEHDVTYFDIADIYGNGESEILFGKILKNNPSIRSKIIIQSKCGIRDGFYDFSYDHIINSVKQSLKRMNIEYLDYLLFHRPDILIDFNEFNRAIKYLKDNNLVKNFGVSNMPSSYLKLLKAKTNIDIKVHQLEFSICASQLIDQILNMNTNNELADDKTGEALEYSYLNNINIQAWSPLKISLQEGSFLNNPKYEKLNELLDKLALKYNTNKAAISLAFILRLPFNINPVVGASSIKHLDEALESLDINLDKKEFYSLYILGGHILP